MVEMANASIDEKVNALNGVDNAITVLIKKLNSTTPMTYKVANIVFTELHTRAAWTDLLPLAPIADQIWDVLSKDDADAHLDKDARIDLKKSLMTYKFILDRFKNELGQDLSQAS
jgi:hypothetical protein